ncbi:hypothetical protein, partial [Mycobacteroides abscessus]|uniref:hypothetical protein n=1 Tax=Mycobacteroides abscessus TaxID=36809 RepID=UPI001A98D41F
PPRPTHQRPQFQQLTSHQGVNSNPPKKGQFQSAVDKAHLPNNDGLIQVHFHFVLRHNDQHYP